MSADADISRAMDPGVHASAQDAKENTTASVEEMSLADAIGLIDLRLGDHVQICDQRRRRYAQTE